MPDEKSLQQIANDLMKIKGNEKGHASLTIFNYIKKKEGEEGLKKVKKMMRTLGSPFDIDKMKNNELYPVGISNLGIVVAQKIFNWKDEDLLDMGYSVVSFSPIVRIYSRLFISLENLLDKISKIYETLYNFGDLNVIEINKEKKYYIIRLIRYGNFPKATCVFFRGTFKKITELVVKSDKITVEETECTHEGGRYHQYTVKW